MESFEIKKIKGQTAKVCKDYLASEVPLTIFIEEKEIVTLLCTPADISDLTAGFLFTSGLIKEFSEIKKIILNKEQWTVYVDLADDSHMEELVFKRMYTSGCGRGTLFYNALDLMHRQKIESELKIKTKQVSKLMNTFQKSSELYLKTGGTHGAAIAGTESLEIFREDIGRHNAIDKVIGAALAENCVFGSKVLLTSGRVSSEVIFKVQKCRIPIVISKSAPTDQTVKHAREMNLTLIGFSRGSRMNVYSGEERIILT